MSLAAATTPRPTVRAPRERAAVASAAVVAASVFAWAAYLTIFINGIPFAGLMLGASVAITVSAVIMIGWFNLRQAIATVDVKIEQLHTDHGRIVADLQASRIEARREHTHRIALALDDEPSLASVTSLHGPR